MTTYTYTHARSGITVTWTGGTGAYALSHDHKLLIQNHPNLPVVIQSYSPEWDAVVGRNGACLGVPGENVTHAMDFREAPLGFGINDQPPLVVPRNQMYVICKSSPDSHPWSTTAGWPKAQSYSNFEFKLPVVVVDYDPTGLSSTFFSPIGYGDNAPINSLRSALIPFSLIDARVSALPTDVVVDAAFLTATNITTGDIDTLYAALLEGFTYWAGEMYFGGSIHSKTPGNQNFGYGGEWGAAVSNALTLLCTDYLSNGQKQALARKMTQYGIDLFGAAFDGRLDYADGGHMSGRKALICFAGHMLNINLLKFISRAWDHLPASSPFQQAPFCEDGKFFMLGENFGPSDGFYAAWRKNSSAFSGPDTDGSQWAAAPADYSGGWETQLNGYWHVDTARYIGTALFFKLIGAEEAIGEALVQNVAQWCDTDWTTGAPAAWLASLGPFTDHTSTLAEYPNGTNAFGGDYGQAPWTLPGFCAGAWKTYAP